MDREVIKGPRGDVVLPLELDAIEVAGFMLTERGSGHVHLDILGPPDRFSRQTVAARLAFTAEGVQQFLHGLMQVEGTRSSHPVQQVRLND
jgi:hypothetical protein